MNNNVLYELDSRYISDVLKLRFTPANAVRAEDVYLYDIEEKKYLDMSAGWAVMNLGYSNKTVAEAIKKQIETLSFAGVISCVSKESIELAQKICGLLPGDFEKKVWYGHSGSDANEFVAKMIPYATGRPAILTFEGSYHGQTLGAYAMSGHPSLTAFAKDSSANPKLPYPDYYRDGAGMTPEEYDIKCLDYIENVFFKDKFDPYKVGAEGGLLAMGDLHAAMGDGESFYTGLEVAGEVTVTVNVRKDLKMDIPFVLCEDKFASIATDSTVDGALEKAMEKLVYFISDHSKLDFYESGFMCGLYANLEISQVVDPVKTARMSIKTKYLKECGIEI